MTREQQIRETLDLFGRYQIGAPLTLDDCADLYKDLRKNMPDGTILDVTMRGTEDRQHDGSGLRIEIVADGQMVTMRPSSH